MTRKFFYHRSFRYFPIKIIICLSFFVSCASAYQYFTDGFGHTMRWKASDISIPYKVNDFLPNVINPIGAVIASFQAWEDVSSASIAFTYKGTTDAEIGFDGENVVVWNYETYTPDWGYIGAIGLTYFAFWDITDGTFLEVDIAMNMNLPWSTTGEINKVDIQGVMTHEIGHMIGLAHTDKVTVEPVPTMIDGPTFFATHVIGDEILLRTLEQDDIDGISTLYPPGYAKSSVETGNARSGCFISTAAFGTPLAKEVITLCRFRDRYLLSNSPGRNLVELYYRFSPSIADIVAKSSFLRFVVRTSLKPLIAFCNLLLCPRILVLVMEGFALFTVLVLLINYQRSRKKHSLC